MKILAIESSCDETSAAVIDQGEILSNIISSQTFHSLYGGVIPELASRAHIENISPIVSQSLQESNCSMNDIEAIAVTNEPGLIGSLLVGSNFAKGLALRYNLPIVPVNHIEGHLYSAFIQDSTIKFPIMALVVSGGHTSLFLVESFEKYSIIGSTIDDASGEAFDKIATLLGLPYPGGPEIDKLAALGNPKKYDFPRSMLNYQNYNFSFSGLKTSVRYFLEKNFKNAISDEEQKDLCASVQQAIVDVLVGKTIRAAVEYKVKTISVSGGVSANSLLRKEMGDRASDLGIKFIAPDLMFCMDNAAMIAFIAEKKLLNTNINKFKDLTFVVNSSALRAKSEKKQKN